MAREIGMIGVGGMGLAMAKNLIAAGHRVTGYRRGPMDDLSAAGGKPAQSPAAVVAAAEVAILSLPNDAAVTDVLHRADGVLSALRPGQVVIETTSLTPEQKRRHGAQIAASGGVMLDCPLSGTPQMMRSGRGAMFVSGDRAVADGLADLFDAIAASAIWVGETGAGAATKAVATALVAIHNLAAAEGLAIAAREGGDLEAVHRAISGSPAGSAMFELRGALMAKRDYTAGSGSIEGYLRGLTQVMDAVGAPERYPLLALTHAQYRAAVAAGQTGRDQASIFEFVMERP